MKRLQISIPEDLDEALGAEAVRQRKSKAALIRELVANRLGPGPTGGEPLDELVGSYDQEPGSVDDVVYGR